MGMHNDVMVLQLDVIQCHAIERQQYLRSKHSISYQELFRVVCSMLDAFHREWH